VYNRPSAEERFIRNRLNRRMISFLVCIYIICTRSAVVLFCCWRLYNVELAKGRNIRIIAVHRHSHTNTYITHMYKMYRVHTAVVRIIYIYIVYTYIYIRIHVHKYASRDVLFRAYTSSSVCAYIEMSASIKDQL